MSPQEFEPVREALKTGEEHGAILQIVGDQHEERGDLASAKLCLGQPPIPLVWLPAGKFPMGSPKTEKGRRSSHNEAQVRVRLTQGFWLGKCLVTQEQWTQVMGISIQDQAKLARNPLCGEGPNYPMYYINWNEAKEFCLKYSESERKAGRLPEKWVFDLPTEAQWEYACRADSSQRFCFGDDESELDEYAWFANNSHRQTHEVAQKKANAWGLHDMHGNVYEWCQDGWSGKLPGGSDPFVSPKDEYRVFRGGSWFGGPSDCRSAYRLRHPVNYRCNVLGFRLALTSCPTF